MEDLFNYKIKEDGTVSVTGFKEDIERQDITMPSEVTIEGKLYKVTDIGERAFCRKNLTNLVISDGIYEIKKNAFGDNRLTTLTIPKSVIKIGDIAFTSNYLTEINICGQLVKISPSAFYNNYFKNDIPDDVLIHTFPDTNELKEISKNAIIRIKQNCLNKAISTINTKLVELADDGQFRLKYYLDRNLKGVNKFVKESIKKQYEERGYTVSFISESNKNYESAVIISWEN